MAAEMGLMGHQSGFLTDNGDFIMEEDDDFDFDDDEMPHKAEVEGAEATSQDAQAKTIRSQQVYIEQLEDSNLRLQERIWILEQQLRATQPGQNALGDSEQEEDARRGMSPSESDGEGILGLGRLDPLLKGGRGDENQERGCERDDESLQASAA